MNAVSTPGVNLAKDTLFSVHGIDGEGAATVRCVVLRNRLAELVAQLPPCLKARARSLHVGQGTDSRKAATGTSAIALLSTLSHPRRECLLGVVTSRWRRYRLPAALAGHFESFDPRNTRR